MFVVLTGTQLKQLWCGRSGEKGLPSLSTSYLIVIDNCDLCWIQLFGLNIPHSMTQSYTNKQHHTNTSTITMRSTFNCEVLSWLHEKVCSYFTSDFRLNVLHLHCLPWQWSSGSASSNWCLLYKVKFLVLEAAFSHPIIFHHIYREFSFFLLHRSTAAAKITLFVIFSHKKLQFSNFHFWCALRASKLFTKMQLNLMAVSAVPLPDFILCLLPPLFKWVIHQTVNTKGL